MRVIINSNRKQEIFKKIPIHGHHIATQLQDCSVKALLEYELIRKIIVRKSFQVLKHNLVTKAPLPAVKAPKQLRATILGHIVDFAFNNISALLHGRLVHDPQKTIAISIIVIQKCNIIANALARGPNP